MINENHLPVTKTARYYTYGELNENTQTLWFVCHGYGQPAAKLIKHFTVLSPTQHYVVAPEALSRFYWKGFGGDPVPSWMTAEDRNNEIKDYVNYLNQLYAQTMAQLPPSINKANLQINVLGFSQGTATISRWIADGKAPCNKLIFWAGRIAHDLEWTKAQTIFQQADLYVIYGKQDPFIMPQHLDAQHRLLEAQALPVTIHTFKGKHELHRDTLVELFG